ncbi:MAG TPA: 2-oxoglutarate dehydrogenase E1 component, partial [Candidatus Polarisedimenticolia bacterium]|nr:2-oxoglutarate dehydrogenase E1 component [Candidatus Polarisedimenticolia bacterium]
MDSARLVDLFRRWGHLQADLDPLGRLQPRRHPDLEAAITAGGVDPGEVSRLRRAYCGPLGVEFMQIPDPERCRFIAERLEAGAAAGPLPAPERRRLLARLAATEIFERFLHQRFIGTKRYSLEGAAALIPLLDAVLEAAAEKGVEIVLIGMPHRGRLNVMTHVVGVPAPLLFAGFEDIEPRSVLGGGDLKYHQGATGTWKATGGRGLQVHLVSNPSHLEAVDPVVMGRARARQERLGADGRARVLPVTLHGDAAFAGQGITAETLNLADLEGFSVGGTVRVVVNNLIGFTAEPRALHSSRYASDVARRLDIPILHVNGQDPEAVARAGRLALEYRAAFASDVVVDLICYRRYGHSEVDDPTTTQPLLYARLEALPRLYEHYAIAIGAGAEETARLERQIEEALTGQLEQARAMKERPLLRRLPDYWGPYAGGRYEPSKEVDSGVEAARLRAIAARLTTPPDGFHIHPKVAKGLEQRREMAEGRRAVDWGMAEALALGSLLWDGVPVRLTGQDSRRGTFNQRHAVWVDGLDGREHVPLQHLRDPQGPFGLFDTALSEAAPLGFEYGYSRDSPETLVLWEAQFGDFANGAQVIIDQFVVAGEDKWGLLSGLVLLLPHGYEGQGPEHSSARVERFLDLAGEDSGRGTFTHRHAVLHDQNREKWDSGNWVPLEHIKEGQPPFEVIDS